MKQLVGVRTIKTGIGATVGIVIAEMMGLSYSASAGIVAILSIQSTKKESVQIAIRRFYAAIIGLLLAVGLFEWIGYHAVVFGIYITCFIPIAVKLKVREGIVPTAVLVTHILGEGHASIALLLNEIFILLVGVGVALFLNLYMPSSEKAVQQLRHKAEVQMQELFNLMSKALLENADSIAQPQMLKDIQITLEAGRKKAYKEANNYFFNPNTVAARYFDMRLKQFQVLTYMQEHFRHFFMQYQETKEVALFMDHVALSVRGEKSCYGLMQELGVLRQHFKNSQLPMTREEFENRAMLYQFLNDLEHFLEIKKDFREAMTEEELEEYQRGYKSDL